MRPARWHHANGTIVLSGDIDCAAVPRLKGALVEHARSGEILRLDFTDVTYLDSTALHALIEIHQAGRQVVIERPTKMVLRLLDITGSAKLFDVTP